mgnify:CR=1 FL=1|tara:strand:- start:5577 stop:7067 length:1491 start_codon:yes stop_codon:yes gene_type:complete
MGLIDQTNQEYYTGSDVHFEISSVSTLQSRLDIELWDNVPNEKPANYKIFVDPTGSGAQQNYIEFPSFVDNGVIDAQGNGSLINSVSVSNSQTYLNSPPNGWITSAISPNGSGVLFSFIVLNFNITTVTVINGGSSYLAGETLTIPANALGVGSASFTLTLSSNNLFTGSTYSVSSVGTNKITFSSSIPGPISPYTEIAVKIQLQQQSIWDNYGSYEYVKLDDIVDNFIVGYTGTNKLLETIPRSQIVFHAKRGLQEFSYDTLRSVKSQELDLQPNNSCVIPQDYVNYVQVSWVDHLGVKHPIYPTTLTSSPTQPIIQDGDGTPIQGEFGQNLLATPSETNRGWRKNNDNNLNGLIDAQDLNANIYNWTWWDAVWGQRYGLEPEVSNMNGWFDIDRRRNMFNFSSNLKDQLIILEYISDGLAYDGDTKVPKMAEQAMYMHIAYSLLSTMPNIQEYIVRRYKVDRRAALRNAKIRLSNIKLSEFVQIMRGKSKWIKH